MWNWKQRFTILLIGASLLAAPGAALAQAADTVIFAAASLKNALDAIAADWQKETGSKSKISYAASSTLAKQLEQSAPADLFISADLEWMDYVEQRQLIQTASRINLLGNKLVLIGPKGGLKDGTTAIALVPGVDLLKPLAGGRLAMGMVNSVPAGKYGKAALEHLGAWDKVKSQIAEAESVRVALTYVSRGEAPLGIVYQTDAAADPAVAVFGTFPATSHPPIIYPAALTKEAKASAAALLSYLKSAKAKGHFEAQGFHLLAD